MLWKINIDKKVLPNTKYEIKIFKLFKLLFIKSSIKKFTTRKRNTKYDLILIRYKELGSHNDDTFENLKDAFRNTPNLKKWTNSRV